MTSSSVPSPGGEVVPREAGSDSQQNSEQADHNPSADRDIVLLITDVWKATIAITGVGCLGFAAALLFAPEVVASSLPITRISQHPVFSNALLRSALFVIFGLMCALWIAWTTRSRTGGGPQHETATERSIPDFETLRSDPPEAASGTPVVGASFDAEVTMATDAAVSGESDRVRDQLRSVTVDGLVAVDGYSVDEAQSRVDEGAWTDDAVAAAYLADRESTLSFRRRFMAWLRPAHTKRRRIDRTIDVIATRFDTGTGDDRDDAHNP